MSNSYAPVNPVDAEDPPPSQSGLQRNEGTRAVESWKITHFMTLEKVQQDSTNKMWSEYMEDVNAYDTTLTDTWKEDATGVLTFVSPDVMTLVFVAMTNRKTSIFSATVAAFIIESYKKLSPDAGDQTVFLLGQISQQLSGLANGTIVPPQPYPSSPPSASIICVNGLWLLSLMLSTTSALFATMTQQWVSRYLQLPQIPSVPRKRARVRSYLFLGTLKYAMHHAVETAPTLLHLSVFLFNIGLVIFFFPIHKTVAIILLVSVAIFGVAYFVVTILPCLDRICPYCTPMSNISWYLWHFLPSLVASILQRIVKLFHTLLVPYNLGNMTNDSPWRQKKLAKWLVGIENALKNQSDRLTDGYRESIVKDALKAPQNIDVKALTWLFQLPALTEESKFERYVAGIPGEIIVQLFIKHVTSGKVSFLEHLSSLLRSCAPGTTGLDENTSRLRLLVCLDAVHHIAKASAVPSVVSQSHEPVIKEVRIKFANMRLMRELWAHGDPTIRMTARSICALLAKPLLHKDSWLLGQPELAWLQDVLGELSTTIYSQLGDYTVLDNMNIDSFVYGVFSHQTGYSDLPSTQATSFIETLAILMSSGTRLTDVRRETFDVKFESLIRRVEAGSHQHRDNIVDKLRRIFQDVFPSAVPPQQAPNT
jgi:hypothetical protein